VLYLDASAIVKLVRSEPETPALVEAIRADPEVVSSALSWTEVVRAARRARVRTTRATAVLNAIAAVPIDDGILRDAAELAPTSLRTLDAIHLASARSLGEDIDAVITYDERMIEAATSLALTVRVPGVDQS
jgi:predicted nucleic acid-binding protein